MAITVFYAWQSDRDGDVCRFLIRDAAKLAVKKLNPEATVAVKSAPPFDLDHDTKGTTGHQHIASVIRKKIRGCGIFVADLTHVVSYRTADRRRKRAQNPNVLIELGIAIRAKGFGRLILVMNDAFGPPDDLPFDLKSHSYPITYTLKDTSDPEAVKTAKEGLAEAIKAKLRLMLADINVESKGAEDATARGRVATAEQRRRDMEASIKGGTYSLLSSSGSYLVLSVIPLRPPTPPLDIAKIAEGGQHDFKPMQANGWSLEHYGRSFLLHNGSSARSQGITVPTSTSELYDDGTVFAVLNLSYGREKGDADWRLAFQYEERNVISGAARYIDAIRRLSVTGPLLLGISLLSVGKLTLLPENYQEYRFQPFRPLRRDEVRFDGVVFDPPPDGEVSLQAVADALRPTFLILWRESGMSHDPCFGRDGKLNNE